MFFGSYSEFIYITAFIIAYNAIRWLFPHLTYLRRIFMLLGSLSIVATIIDINSLFILILLMLGAYGIGKILEIAEIPASKRKKLLAATLGFLILLFCIRNYHWLGDAFTKIGLDKTVESISFVGRIGLSYILFRLLHFLVDAYRGKLMSLNLMSFLNYIFFFPTFMSGPIDRYNNFRFWEGNHKAAVSLNLIYMGSARVFIGAIKKMMIVPLILPYVNELDNFSQITQVWQLQVLLTVLAYTFYIYFDFSGYSDIAIGTAYLIGIRTPENFNNPYLSKDIAEFWKKWHISFSSILTEYVFKPFVIGLSNRFKNAPRLRISIIGYLYTFIICGLWHGSTMNFVYWGLWHGVGLAIYKAWDMRKSKNLSDAVFIKGLRSFAALSLTFVFVSLGWYFFMTNTNEIHNVLKNEIAFLNTEYNSGKQVNLTGESAYWKGYGHGIGIYYNVPEDVLVEVQYRPINETEWISAVTNLPGSKPTYQVTGEFAYGGNKRNLEPGLYVIRMRSNESDVWYGDVFHLNNYMEDE